MIQNPDAIYSSSSSDFTDVESEFDAIRESDFTDVESDFQSLCVLASRLTAFWPSFQPGIRI